MNWETHGDTTSLMIYDTVYQLCKEMSFPLFHVTMLTKPRNKKIIFGRNDDYRYGNSNHTLVEVMERSRFYMTNLSLAAKKERRDRFKAAKNYYREVTHKYKMRPRLRSAFLKEVSFSRNDFEFDSEGRMFYTPCKPGIKVSGLQLPQLEEQEKMIPEISTYFRRMNVEVKMIFNRRGRNNVQLKGIKYFEGSDKNERRKYFDSTSGKLRKSKKPQIVLIEPDMGIADFATTDVTTTRNSYIYADEISQVQNSISKDSIIAVKHTFHSPFEIKNKSQIYPSLLKSAVSICDKRTNTGLILFFNNPEIERHVRDFVETNIRRGTYS